MNDFVTNLLDPSWWIGVVVIGFIINILSSYAKPAIDRIWGHWSVRRQSKLESETRDFENKVSDLVADPEKFRNVQLDILFYNIRMTFFLLASVANILLIVFLQQSLLEDINRGTVFFSVVVMITVLISGLILFTSFVVSYYNKSFYNQRLLYEAEKRRSENVASRKKGDGVQVETKQTATRNREL